MVALNQAGDVADDEIVFFDQSSTAAAENDRARLFMPVNRAVLLALEFTLSTRQAIQYLL